MDKLVEILQKQLEFHKKEYKLACDRFDAIEKNDIKKLNKTILEERELTKNIENLENQRLELFEDKKHIKLIDYINDLADEEIKKKLLNIRTELKSIIEDIVQKNNDCKNIIEISNEMLEKVLKELSGKKEIGYNKYKKKENVSSNNLLNTKI
ncbi:FlgN protein [Hypnocyclicus thermotrophus]|uniref:FlgN protein n=1 Tax=Hypnocyclicus thermotrophus TaxID=1627895 RepID=A0AA46DXL7_9FUSO|nr:flagellar export chaperone FlgN [Hypnocyclicus thermotrophus]TDT68076.1 FlgN protein [Hypnocyclicus thermotrophus]